MGAFGRKGLTPHLPDRHDKRGAQRAKVVLPGNLETPGARHTVTLVNVSAIGAHLSGTDLPEEGRFVQLRVGNTMAFGTIIWQRDSNCGVQFDAPLAEATIARFRETANQAAELGLDARLLCEREAWNGWS